MDDLRRDVNEAFDKGQAELGDLSGVRERMLVTSRADRGSRPGNRAQLAAGLAAVLIAVVVIAAFAYVRASNQTSPEGPPRPVPSTSPTPLSQSLDVSADTPVILYHDPGNFDQIDGMTWDGDKSGRVGLGGGSGGTSNPAGTLYGTAIDVRDRAGKVVVALDGGIVKGFNGTWADDERHYCQMVRTGARDVTAPALLQLALPGQRPRTVVQVGTFPSANLNGGGPAVVACSPVNDRAVVYQSGGQGVGVKQFWVIQLSTGHIVWSGGSGSAIAASHDGEYVALEQGSLTAPITAVYGPKGSVLARLETDVYSFSWDGSLAVTQARNGPVTVIRWRDGSVVWTGPGVQGYFYSQASAEPGGVRLAIGILNGAYTQGDGFPLVDLYVIAPDGQLVCERNSISLL